MPATAKGDRLANDQFANQKQSAINQSSKDKSSTDKSSKEQSSQEHPQNDLSSKTQSLNHPSSNHSVAVAGPGNDLLAEFIPEKTRVHCIGIGGVGVSAIAEMLVARGFQVSGSDAAEHARTLALRQLGVSIYIGHQRQHVHGAQLVVYSSAITSQNVEYAEALARQIPLYKRAQMLASLTMHHQLIAVSGTHGKTTTTGMMVWVLHQAGLAPSFAVGGNLRNLDAYCQLTHGDYAVIEADESDASFLYYDPDMIILTNIDADHLENYGNSFAALKEAFMNFLQRLSAQGFVAVCADDALAMSLAAQSSHKVFSYGQHQDADYRLCDFKQQGTVSHFSVSRPGKEPLALQLNCPGLHNALNATAVVLVADRLQVADIPLQEALRSFSGMGRRFQRHGEIEIGGAKALLVEDYGHHPRELEVTIQAVREVWPQCRLLLVFQPHRFSRVKLLADDFAKVLSKADAVVLLDIYPAGEKPMVGVNSGLIAQAITALNPSMPLVMCEDAEQLPAVLAKHVQAGDLCLLSGAGSIGRFAVQLAAQFGVVSAVGE